jgi:hypothetical protein
MKKPATRKPERNRSTAEERLPWWAWLDAAPAAWLLVLLSAYGVLAWHPMQPTRAPVGGVAAADPLALPFLVLTITAGIIRYFYVQRTLPRTRQDRPAAVPHVETPHESRG